MLSFTIGRSSISVFLDGEFNSIDDSHANYPMLLDELRKSAEDRDLDYIRGMITIEKMLEQLSIGHVTVFEDEIHFDGRPVHNYMTQRMLEIIQQGLDITPWATFMDNVFSNPASYAQAELYEWMEKANMPITPDGHFLAFKKVRADYTDCHTGKFDNSLGNVLEMDRGQCDPIRDHHCSSGFHFASVGYLSHFGGQRVIVVKINPKDVTSIPNDYSFTKGRTCRYEVVAEISSQAAAHHKAWKKGLVNLENPAEFPAEVLSKIKLPTPALNEPVTVRIKALAVEDALDAIEEEQTDAGKYSNVTQPLFDTACRYTPDAPGIPALLHQCEFPPAGLKDLISNKAVTIQAKVPTGAAVPPSPTTTIFTTADGRTFSGDVVLAALEDASIRGAARNLGIQDSTLRGWKKKLGA